MLERLVERAVHRRRSGCSHWVVGRKAEAGRGRRLLVVEDSQAMTLGVVERLQFITLIFPFTRDAASYRLIVRVALPHG